MILEFKYRNSEKSFRPVKQYNNEKLKIHEFCKSTQIVYFVNIFNYSH